ncbi:hypothetical protein BP5796_07777 [Coleophoma crateriformis]|uniref:Uncharacterized protein n=1 Tax=Coleophoma crateriformis TaxID=565419 RepID=A0A3D8RCG4_9HELO|nr:hypothetical protein BP5796_07777 [Coleophoma crateriformis]
MRKQWQSKGENSEESATSMPVSEGLGRNRGSGTSSARVWAWHGGNAPRQQQRRENPSHQLGIVASSFRYDVQQTCRRRGTSEDGMCVPFPTATTAAMDGGARKGAEREAIVRDSLPVPFAALSLLAIVGSTT